MKKILLFFVVIVASSIIYAQGNFNTPVFVEDNIYALEQESRAVYDGALYANNDLNTFCCGSGNVRNCAQSQIPACDSIIE